MSTELSANPNRWWKRHVRQAAVLTGWGLAFAASTWLGVAGYLVAHSPGVKSIAVSAADAASPYLKGAPHQLTECETYLWPPVVPSEFPFNFTRPEFALFLPPTDIHPGRVLLVILHALVCCGAIALLTRERRRRDLMRPWRFFPIFVGSGLTAVLAAALAFFATAFWVSLRERMLIAQSGTMTGGLWIETGAGIRAGPVAGGLTLYLAVVAMLARRSVPAPSAAAPPKWLWCTGCGYLLGGDTCPECGNRSPRALPAAALGWWQLRVARRVGRHWLAGLTVVVVTAGLFWPLIAGTAKQWAR